MRSPLTVAWVSIALSAAAVLWVVLRENRDESRLGTARRQPAPVLRSDVPDMEAAPSLAEAAAPVVHIDDMTPINVPMAEDNPKVVTPDVVAESPPADPADRQPIDVPLAADIPRIDVAAQLSQPILEFAQDKPVEVRRLLRQVAELGAVPIDVSRVDVEAFQERLDRPVSITLKETTVGAILQALILQADLRFEVANGVIVLYPAEPK